MRKHARRPPSVQTGTISGVHDHGTIILVTLRSERGWAVPVFFDRRMFHSLLVGEGCGAEGLIGRRASYDGRSLMLLDGGAT